MSVAFFNLAVLYVPKRISWMEIYGTILVSIVLHLIIDSFLDIKYNLYGYFDEGVNFKTLIFTFGVYPAINVLIVNFYSTLHLLLSKILFILILIILALSYEIALINAGIFYHNDWQIWYSALIYPILLIIILRNWRFITYINKRVE